MSQSDYIKYKKIQQILKDQTKLEKVLKPADYNGFESYQIETTVSNTKNRYSRLLPENRVSVMEMEKRTTSCPTFVLCRNTQTRPNRELNVYALQEAKPTVRIDRQTNKKIGEEGKEPIENSTQCTFQISDTIIRKYTCYKLPKLCKCGTRINPQMI